MPLTLLAKKGEAVDLASLVAAVRKGVKGRNCGCIISFMGIVRPKTQDGELVDHLEYEVYEEAARRSLENMVKALLLVDGVLDLAICHRYGSFNPGEEVLYVVVGAERTEVAFDTLRLAVTRAKHELPIWKKEFTSKGDYWVDLE